MMSVTCCCTCRAVAPGQSVRTTMTLKVNGGSSDCASLPYDSTPKSVTSARMKITNAWCRRVQADKLKPSLTLIITAIEQGSDLLHMLAGVNGVHAGQHHIVAVSQAARDGGGALAVAGDGDGPQLEGGIIRTNHPDRRITAPVKNGGRRHLEGRRTVCGRSSRQRRITGHAATHRGSGFHQGELHSIRAALRISGGRHLAHARLEAPTRQGRQCDARGLADDNPAQV